MLIGQLECYSPPPPPALEINLGKAQADSTPKRGHSTTHSQSSTIKISACDKDVFLL